VHNLSDGVLMCEDGMSVMFMLEAQIEPGLDMIDLKIAATVHVRAGDLVTQSISSDLQADPRRGYWVATRLTLPPLQS
jgi:hypothetical protein